MWYFFEMGGVEGRIFLFDTQLFQLLINPSICTSRDTTYFWDEFGKYVNSWKFLKTNIALISEIQNMFEDNSMS